MNPQEEFGKLLKRMREEHDLSFTELSLKLESLGVKVDRSNLKHMEDGKTKILNPLVLNGLAKIYQTDAKIWFKMLGYLDVEYSDSQHQLKLSRKILRLPVYKSASAGRGLIPYDSGEELEVEFDFEGDYYGTIAVSGDSMQGVFDEGDIALVKHTNFALEDGLIVVACIDEEVFIKRLGRDARRGNVILMSDNKEYMPITIHPDDNFKIIGVVVGRLYRNGFEKRGRVIRVK